MSFNDWPTLGILSLLVEWAIRVVMVVVVPFRRSPEAAKGWLLIIFFLPWVGLPLYWLIGRAKLPAWRVARLAQVHEKMAAVAARLRHHPHLAPVTLQATRNGAEILARNLGQLPPLGGNQAEILADYNASLARLAADIDAAQTNVHLLYYIIADDLATQPILEALARAAQRGVHCRVLMDAVGTGRKALRQLLPKLRALGVEAYEMLPVSLWRPRFARLDLRNHRKIAVIDGQVGYIGSQNLIDCQFKKGICYEELVARVAGPGVLTLQYVFVSDWFVETEELLDTPAEFPAPDPRGDLIVQTLPSGPAYATPNNQRFVVALIHAAQTRVVMTTPYLIPDEPLLQALQTAVLRGAEVHLVVSKLADQFLVGYAQRSYYEELLEAGVKLHRYTPNFLHAKHLSIDDDIALIGSSNMDIRSFLLNSEISLLFYDADFAARLRLEQERYFQNSEMVLLAEWRKRPLWEQVLENLARLFSPLL